MERSQTTSPRNLFALRGTAGRDQYLLVGVVLMMVKYLTELGVVLAATGRVYSLWDFFSPLLASREKYVQPGAEWLPAAWLLWTIPFVWVAVAMTFRRAADAGITRWVSLGMLVPLVNFGVMIGMALIPSAGESDQVKADDTLASAWQSPATESPPPERKRRDDNRGLKAALVGLAFGLVYTITVTVISVYGLGSYGAALFYGAPIVTGAASAYVYNRPVRRRLGKTMLHTLLVTAACSCMFLLVGLEGVICIVMAFPILAPMMMLGAAIGRSIAIDSNAVDRDREDRGMLGCMLLLPILAAAEPMVTPRAEYMVQSELVINAPPTEVWETVVAFPEITAPPDWYFRWGIAMPIRARIEGHGVGAVRYCEFTTGAFVEPITIWKPAERLAFDVSQQPEPMYELTPYRHLHPPHLRGALLSKRGEFELIRQIDGSTLLVGRTWYTLDLAPHAYWRVWTDLIVHRIHLRVLDHIARVVEKRKR